MRNLNGELIEKPPWYGR